MLRGKAVPLLADDYLAAGENKFRSTRAPIRPRLHCAEKIRFATGFASRHPRSGWGIVVALSCALAVEVASAQTRTAADGPWTGWVRCEITAQGAGYSDHQTHTWVMTGGAPRVEGVFRVYPATWTVVGGGSLGRTQTTNVTAEWATSGQSSNAPIAVWTRGDGHLVFTLRHDQLRAPNGFTGYRFYTTDGKDQPRQAIAAETYEYRFQPIDDAPANSITGSSTVPVPSSNAFAPTPQPGSTATSSCSWQFVQSGTPIAPPSTSSAAATGTTTAPTTLRSAGSPPTIQSTATQTTTSTNTTTTSRDQTLSENTLRALTTLVASAPTTLVASEPPMNVTITPTGVISGQWSFSTLPILMAGAKVTFRLTLTMTPGSTVTPVVYPPTAPDQSCNTVCSSSQTTSKTTSTTGFQTVNLTFDSNDGETEKVTFAIDSIDPIYLVDPSATFTFQTTGTHSVSVSGTVTTRTRVDTVATTTTTVCYGGFINDATGGPSCDTSTTTQVVPTVIEIKSYQVSARLQL